LDYLEKELLFLSEYERDVDWKVYQIGSFVFDTEVKAEAFSELAKIRNTLAHRYLDMKWGDIQRFLYPTPCIYDL
jgi:hypothetical protein